MSFASSNNNTNGDDLMVTLVNTSTGQSETFPLPSQMLLRELFELSLALFFSGSDPKPLELGLFKDGKKLSLDSNISLRAAGIQSGDLIALMASKRQPTVASPRNAPSQSQPRQPTSPAPSSGGLDFSNLLGSSNNNNNSVAPSPEVPPVMYYPGMSVEDAMHYNPHPKNFVRLLQMHDHLFKELRYHQPQLAERLKNKSLDQAEQVWREEMVKGGIATAVRQTELFHQRQTMERRLALNPKDPQALEYFAQIDRKQKVDRQYMQMMEQYPESLGRVLMLYVDVKINGHAIPAFCDSGAQMTIMSKKVAHICGLQDLIDDRFAGVAAGVGTGKILGRIHIVQLQIGQSFFPCSVSVMDDPEPGATEMPFLLGLDMMKRHLCQIDLQKGVLKFNTPAWGERSKQEEIPFLHEKDLDQKHGGTKGFDPEKANEELQKLWNEHEKKNNNADQKDE